MVEITYVILSTNSNVTNTAEISGDDSSVYGTSDIDSLPDANEGNDELGADNQLDGNGTDDEDDSDIALLDVTSVPVVVD